MSPPSNGSLWARFQREDSNRLFQSFSSRNAKKEKGKPTPAFLVVTMNSMDFGLVAFLVNLDDPFRTGFGIAIDFFVALLFNELISGIVERPDKGVNAGR